jgi:Nickel responsive protein SCO4226-like
MPDDPEERSMPKFVIEREIVGAGKLPKQELQAISQKSCSVLQNMGPKIQWLQSYVTDDKIYCVYIAPDEETVKIHAQKGGFPANVVARVRSVINPTTAK